MMSVRSSALTPVSVCDAAWMMMVIVMVMVVVVVVTMMLHIPHLTMLLSSDVVSTKLACQPDRDH